MNAQEKLTEAQRLFTEVKVILEQKDVTAEDAERRDKMFATATQLRTEAEQLDDIAKFALSFQEQKDTVPQMPGFESFGHWLQEVNNVTNTKHRGLSAPHPALRFLDKDKGEEADNLWLSRKAPIPTARKDLLEQTMAVGGALVPVEFRAELLRLTYEENPIRARATVIPMARRQLNMPILDQTGTGANATRQYGGVVASWTEEATEKPETEPNFRQIELVAHKLTCYTEASDELLMDSAIALVALLTQLFGGAIAWEEEFAFLQGTGAGQPLGVLNAAATIVVARNTAAQINPIDIFNMIARHIGPSPVWHINRGAVPQLLNLNGPAANPSYIFIPSARDNIPSSLMGFPIFWTEKLPVLGQNGDILLASWPNYLIGDRQATTIASSTEFRFRDDITAWRAVHRVDGQPWLSQPIQLADGVTTISPFVILGAAAS